MRYAAMIAPRFACWLAARPMALVARVLMTSTWLIILSGSTGASAIVVDPSGGGDATTFQQGVDLVAANGWRDTLIVQPAYYDESVLLAGDRDTRTVIWCPGGPEATSVRALGMAAPNALTKLIMNGLTVLDHVDLHTVGLELKNCRFDGPFSDAGSVFRTIIADCSFAGRVRLAQVASGVMDIHFIPILERCVFRAAPLYFGPTSGLGGTVIRNCTFEGPADTAVTAGLFGDAGHTVDQCTFRNVGFGYVLLFGPGENLSMERCRFEGIGQVAINYRNPAQPSRFYQAPSLTVQHSSFRSCGAAIRWIEPDWHSLRMVADTILGCREDAVVYYTGKMTVRLDSLIVRDGLANGLVLIPTRHPELGGHDAVNLNHCDISENAGNGLVVRDSLGAFLPHRIENSRFEHNSLNGVDGIGGAFLIRESLFHANGAAGLATISTTDRQFLPDSIERNTCVLNGGDGITFMRIQGPQTSLIANNLVAGNGQVGLRINGAPAGPIEHNDAWMNTGGNYAGVPAGPQNLELDPGFCDALGGDFHVQTASPCAPTGPFGQIGAFGVGCDASLVKIDLDPEHRHDPTINLHSREKVTFAILSHPLFDPAAIDPSTVTISGASASDGGPKNNPRWWRDLNGDGVRDLVMTVRARDLELKPGDHTVEMDARLRSGLAIHGTDEVRVKGKRPHAGRDGEFDPDETPELDVADAPIAFAIERVWPNPARLDTRLAFSLPASGAVHVELIDITGRRVGTRDLGVLEAGSHTIALAGRQRIAAGVYFVRISFGSETRTVRFAVVD